MEMFERISSPDWNPFTARTSSIFNALKKEKFSPFALRIKEIQLKDYGAEGSPIVNGYILKSNIEYLFYHHRKNLFSLDNSRVFLDEEYQRLKNNKDIDGLIKYSEKKEVENFLISKYFNSNKKMGVSSCQWFVFLDKLLKEFNININDIKFSSITDDGSPADKFNKQNELNKKDLNILSWAVSFNASLPELEALIKLGADVLNISKRDFFNIEENFFLSLMSDKQVGINKKIIFLEKMLNIEPKLLTLSTEKSFGDKNSLFIILSSMKDEDKEKLCMIIYNKFKDELEKISIPKVKDNFGLTLAEDNLYDFLYNNSLFVKSKIEKEKIKSLLNIKEESIIKKRI